MDLDLDDLDFGDKIKEFLEHKLMEIKSSSSSLEEKIKNRRCYLLQNLKANNVSQNEGVIVNFTWKKYLHKKFVLCYSITNSSNRCLENVKPILKWSSTKRLNYRVLIYDKIPKDKLEKCNRDSCLKLTDELTHSHTVHNEAFVIVVIESQNFLEQLNYTLSGKLCIRNDNEEIFIDLPTVQISSEDITDRKVSEVLLGTGNVDNLLTVISSSEKTELVFIFPKEWNVPLDSTFEINCSLTKMDIPSSCKKYFLANRISRAFDNSILELHVSETELYQGICAVAYHSSRNALFLLLHHIHHHITGLMVIPRELFENYKIKNSKEDENVHEILEKFQNSVNDELKLISSQGVGSKEFRRKLTHLENKTDFLYLQICELNNCNV